MDNHPRSPWADAAAVLRLRVDETVDRMSDLIKDALLDGLAADDPDDGPAAPELPPLAADAFVERMRNAVEAALREVAELVNRLPGEALPEAVEDEAADVFGDLLEDALRTAVRMRTDAARAADPDGAPRPAGEWARRWRLMHPARPDGGRFQERG